MAKVPASKIVRVGLDAPHMVGLATAVLLRVNIMH